MALEIRAAVPGDAAAIAAVHVAGWHENYRGLIPDEIIEARSFERRLALWSSVLPEPDRTTYVACEPDGTICGFASAIVLNPPFDGFESFLQTLYLLARSKRRGTGSALLGAVAADLRNRGCRNMALRVLRLNDGARAFYECLGARLLPNFTHDAGSLDDVAYGFDDLTAL